MSTYATLAQLKEAIDPNGEIEWADANDLNLTRALAAATEWIDERTGLSFAATTATKYETADFADILDIEDLLTVTTLKTDDDADGVYETTWTTDDYILEPRNDDPKRAIRVNPNGDYDFPVGVLYGVEIVGSWGTATAPPERVRVACLLIAHRLWKRHEVLFGIAGTGTTGVMVIKAKITEDSDVVALLDMADLGRLF